MEGQRGRPVESPGAVEKVTERNQDCSPVNVNASARLLSRRCWQGAAMGGPDGGREGIWDSILFCYFL